MKTRANIQQNPNQIFHPPSSPFPPLEIPQTPPPLTISFLQDLCTILKIETDRAPSCRRKKEAKEKKKKTAKFRLNFATTSGWLANCVLMHGTKGGWTRTHKGREREKEGRPYYPRHITHNAVRIYTVDRDDHNGSVTSSTCHGAPGL